MLSAFFKYCDTAYQLSTESKAALAAHIQIKEFKAESYILKPGHTANYACFVENGLVRSYYIKDEQEVTTKFLPTGSFITSIFSFYLIGYLCTCTTTSNKMWYFLSIRCSGQSLSC